jgi:hypothetical protein
MSTEVAKTFILSGYPDFKNLPWQFPLDHWSNKRELLNNLPQGCSRHTVIYLQLHDKQYAFKELPPEVAQLEFENLQKIKDARLPAVTPVGYVLVNTASLHTSVLITCYLERSIPYRSLFSMEHMSRYREHLLDAIAGLLVQLHLAGIFWGDCSLSNTLFRRDAGLLQAYLVDAETSIAFLKKLAPEYRYDDLKILENNLIGDISNLGIEQINSHLELKDAGAYIIAQYQKLWEELTRDVIIQPDENYRVQERIRAINNLGYSIGSLELIKTDRGGNIRLHVVVTDRYYHRDQVYQYTGLCTEEMQARKMVNEIHELKASLSWRENRNISLTEAAEVWINNFYEPTIKRLEAYLDDRHDPAELYCQILENKWYLSEQAHQDVGHATATGDYIQNHLLKPTS